MKKLLATTALVIAATSGAASAQSVLERVLDSINTTNMLPVTGTFANIAENVAVLGQSTEYTIDTDGAGTGITTSTISEAAYNDMLNAAVAAEVNTITTRYNSTTGAQEWVYNTTAYSSSAAAQAAAATAASNTFVGAYKPLASSTGAPVILNAIDGSITNTMNGISEATANVGNDVYAFEEVTVDIGDLSTTVLGAVNTGDITLGVNQDVSEAISGTSSAVSASINQLGGVTDQTALVLNVASNATDVIGSVNNSFTSLNGSIGNVATTVLGAVNTGTITSGINAAVTGVQSGIVGTN